MKKKDMARKCTQKKVGLGNALLGRHGLKNTLKKGRVRKYTTREIRAQRRSRKELGLRNTLPKR